MCRSARGAAAVAADLQPLAAERELAVLDLAVRERSDLRFTNFMEVSVRARLKGIATSRSSRNQRRVWLCAHLAVPRAAASFRVDHSLPRVSLLMRRRRRACVAVAPAR